MDDKTVKATQESVVKWLYNMELKDPNNVLVGRDNCPLCKLYNNPPVTDTTCQGCSVFADTGKRYCHGTPYDLIVGILREWRRATRKLYLREASIREVDAIRDSFTSAAKAEAEYLNVLLPEDKRICTDA